jgi:hypothetical protein
MPDAFSPAKDLKKRAVSESPMTSFLIQHDVNAGRCFERR